MADHRPGDAPYTHRTPRVVAARRLTRRAGRTKAGRFLAEGAQVVAEALRDPARVHEVYVTAEAAARHQNLVNLALDSSVPVAGVTARAAGMLSETVTPQGIVAVCDTVDVPLGEALSGSPRLVAVLAGVTDPGNAGTVIRVADAAGADAVVFAGEAVDPHNGKCVRSSTGSVFHLPIARAVDVAGVISACRAAGLRVLAADGGATSSLDDVATLDAPTAWVFGSEAHGLPAGTVSAADDAVRVPIYGWAESLNLGTAAAVCLYASARAQHGRK